MAAENKTPQTLSLPSLLARCAEQTAFFYQNRESDTRYCFEIFRRAVLERNQDAWGCVYEVYAGQITRWVRRHPSYASTGEPEDYFVNRSLEKLWQAVTPERFTNFPDLGHLLSYLQLCVFSTITDFLRAHQAETLQVEFNRVENITDSARVEEMFETNNQALELWKQVCACLNDHNEQLVAHDSFLLDLKPAEIQARYPLTFTNIKEVYRIKESVLERLRHNPELLRQFLSNPESSG